MKNLFFGKKTEETKKSDKRIIRKITNPNKKSGSEKWYENVPAQFGEMLNYYDITKEISRGAYGIVYKAKIIDPETQESTQHKVAIKAILPTIHHNLVLLELNMLKLC